MASLKPLNDFILVNPEPPPEYHVYKKYTHVIVPEKFEHGPEDRPVWGKVVSRGRKCDIDIKIGSRIVFGKYAGARIKYQNKDVILVREDEVLGIDEPRN